MSNSDAKFLCPVCRARQPLQVTCRRCHADLELVVRARQRVVYLQAERQRADTLGDVPRLRRVIDELRMLSPSAND